MWTYNQKTGVLKHDEIIVSVGYSGHGEGKNNPSKELLSNIGPIPKGLYAISHSFTHPQKGPVVMTLTPKRHGFLIHGDSIKNPGEASEGCIILNKTVRTLIDQSDDKELLVISD